MSVAEDNGPTNVDNIPAVDDNAIKIKLRSNEGNVFDIGLAAAKMSILVKNRLGALQGEDGPDYNEPITLTDDKVTDEVLKKIIEWCEHHWDDPPIGEDSDDEKDLWRRYENAIRGYEEMSDWDKQFIAANAQAVKAITLSAKYMGIKGLVEVGLKRMCVEIKDWIFQYICDEIKNEICEYVRDTLKTVFTPEEEEAIHKVNDLG